MEESRTKKKEKECPSPKKPHVLPKRLYRHIPFLPVTHAFVQTHTNSRLAMQDDGENGGEGSGDRQSRTPQGFLMQEFALADAGTKNSAS